MSEHFKVVHLDLVHLGLVHLGLVHLGPHSASVRTAASSQHPANCETRPPRVAMPTSAQHLTHTADPHSAEHAL